MNAEHHHPEIKRLRRQISQHVVERGEERAAFQLLRTQRDELEAKLSAATDRADKAEADYREKAQELCDVQRDCARDVSEAKLKQSVAEADNARLREAMERPIKRAKVGVPLTLTPDEIDQQRAALAHGSKQFATPRNQTTTTP